MAADDPHFRLRVPAGLKAKIEEAALQNQRSINAEIVDRLEETFSEGDWTLTDVIAKGVSRTIATYRRGLAAREFDITEELPPMRKGEDAIAWIMRVKELGFPDAVNWLAERRKG